MVPTLGHLGVNALFLQPRIGGVGTYVRHLLPELAALRPNLRITVFVNPAGRELLAAEPWADAVELVVPRPLGARGTRALAETFALGAIADRRGVDVLHSVALTSPLRSRAARVLTVADVTWLLHPEPAERASILLWRLLVPPTARRAARVIVHSRSMGAEVARALGIEGDRLDVIPLGHEEQVPRVVPAPDDLRRRLGLGDGSLVLAVSAAKAHKNVELLVRAMAEVRRERQGALLVVPGNRTPLRDRLERLARELGLADAVVFPGWVSDADLEGLYRHADCFAFPSLLEGFGMPVLDAMSRGLPVACARASSMPEVAGDAARYFDPREVSDAARAVIDLLGDRELAAKLADRGRERARGFTWRRVAELHLASYGAAIEGTPTERTAAGPSAGERPAAGSPPAGGAAAERQS